MLRSGWEVRAGEAAWTEDSLTLDPIRDVDKLREIIRDMRLNN